MTFVGVNYLAVLIAAVAAWFAGAIWYGVLGKPWVAAQGKSMETFKQEMAAKAGSPSAYGTYGLAFLANLIIAFMLAGLMWHLGSVTVRGGVVTAVLSWLGFVVTTMAVNNAFGGRKAMLTVIDSGHWLLAMIVAGAVIGAFGI